MKLHRPLEGAGLRETPSCRGVQGAYPGKFLKFASPEMHSGAFSVTRSVFL